MSLSNISLIFKNQCSSVIFVLHKNQMFCFCLLINFWHTINVRIQTFLILKICKKCSCEISIQNNFFNNLNTSTRFIVLYCFIILNVASRLIFKLSKKKFPCFWWTALFFLKFPYDILIYFSPPLDQANMHVFIHDGCFLSVSFWL